MTNVNMDKLGDRIFDLATKYWGEGVYTGSDLVKLGVDDDAFRDTLPDHRKGMQNQLRKDIKDLLGEPDISEDEKG